MGLTALHLEILAEEAKARPFSGAVVTCGVLDSNITFASLWQAASDKGISLRRTRPRLSPNPGQYPGGCLHSACVLESLGFDEVMAMDASDFEGAEILLDLNQEETPKELVGVADVILEGGTHGTCLSFPSCDEAFDANGQAGRANHPYFARVQLHRPRILFLQPHILF